MTDLAQPAKLLQQSQGISGAPKAQTDGSMVSIYGAIKSVQQGDIFGSVTTPGRERSLAIQSLSNGLTVPYDSISNEATGRRQHKELTFSMQADQALPLLLDALINNENLTTAKFDFWRTDSSGTEINVYTIDLFNARLTSYEANAATDGAGNVVHSTSYTRRLRGPGTRTESAQLTTGILRPDRRSARRTSAGRATDAPWRSASPTCSPQ